MISQEGTTAAGRILIIDDEPKISSFVGRALTTAGYLENTHVRAH